MRAVFSMLAVLLAVVGCSNEPPLITLPSVSIDDESHPTHVSLTLINEGGPGMIDRVDLERLHNAAGDPPLIGFAATSDADAVEVRRNSRTLQFDLNPAGSSMVKHSVVYARVVAKYFDAVVFKSEPQVFMLQRRDGALADTFAGPEFAKAALAELEGVKGKEAPGFVKFKAKLAEAAGDAP